jgi:hypothetical protein
MRRRMIIAGAVVAGSTAAFVIPQAAKAQTAPVCVLAVHVEVTGHDVVGPTTICLPPR